MDDFWNPPARTEKEWNSLPPLIAKGQDRAQRIAEIVEAWCTPADPPVLLTILVPERARLVLDNVDFVDANFSPPQAIDLGSLLREVELRLSAQTGSKLAMARRDLHIVLRACRIQWCNAKAVSIRPQLIAIGTRFEEHSSFEDARFECSADFTNAIFGTGVSFCSARFHQGASFIKAQFGVGISFSESVFDGIVLFFNAAIDNNAHFEYAYFSRGISFKETTFGNNTSFNGAIFGESAFFPLAKFGEDTCFDFSSFAGKAGFAGTTFGAKASFQGVTFSPFVGFDDARFGPAGGLDGVVVRSVNLPASTRGDRFAARCDAPRRWFVVNTSWNFVRAAGESAILNRVSMLALIIVPLVAGAWPAVRALVHGYALGLGEAQGAYESARAGLLLEASRVSAGTPVSPAVDVPAIVNRLDEQVSGIAAQLHEAATGPVSLSISWGLLFFGALFVVLGRTVYGWGAPECVRARGRDQTMMADTETFRAAKDQRRDLIVRAIERLQRAAFELPEVRHPSFISRHNRAMWVPLSTEQLDAHKEHFEQYDKDRSLAESTPGGDDALRPAPAHTPEELEAILIEEGAGAEYDVQARRSPVRMNIATFLYAAGLYCIAWLITHQATGIVKQIRGGEYWPDYWGEVGMVLAAAWIVGSIILALPWSVRKTRGSIKVAAARRTRSKRKPR